MTDGTCGTCDAECGTCEDYTGVCTTCADSDKTVVNSVCTCSDSHDDGSGCVPYVVCVEGQYRNATDNTCTTCGTDCEICADETGECTQCAANTYVAEDGINCGSEVTCVYPIGPVESSEPTRCVTEMYSADRVVPPFADELTDFDWRDWGVIRDIVDQGSCGSCWAFMSASAVEGAYAIKTG